MPRGQAGWLARDRALRKGGLVGAGKGAASSWEVARGGRGRRTQSSVRGRRTVPTLGPRRRPTCRNSLRCVGYGCHEPHRTCRVCERERQTSRRSSRQPLRRRSRRSPRTDRGRGARVCVARWRWHRGSSRPFHRAPTTTGEARSTRPALLQGRARRPTATASAKRRPRRIGRSRSMRDSAGPDINTVGGLQPTGRSVSGPGSGRIA